ncbi:conserved hypothetical protein [uncultured Alphaproteobacteria bacterium]|uniref:Mu-like prophage FluMu N-terminal domain-containing protein n=1 Tax=uncultured Alphaproteobacteria bacterium TaxID=91750 RepID=A0A212KN06_9PROT|nr:conserved hypothetical protein [uncultured Alphaproteobacteria bacterium]
MAAKKPEDTTAPAAPVAEPVVGEAAAAPEPVPQAEAADVPVATPITTLPALRVTAKVAGFRRAGLAWPDQPVTVPRGALSADRIEQIKAEPMLVVEEIAAPV